MQDPPLTSGTSRWKRKQTRKKTRETTGASVLKRPVGRPRKIPRTKEEEEEFKRRQMKAMAQRAARAQMMREEDYLDDDDDEDFDEEDLDDDDFESDDGSYFDIARHHSRNRVGRPRVPKPSRPVDTGKQDCSLMCKPVVMSKATSCTPIRIAKVTQTEFGDPDKKQVFIPMEFPLLVPTPMAFNAPVVPFPIPVPVTVNIPNITPMHKNAIDKALGELLVLYESLPEGGEPGSADDDKKLAEILKRFRAEVNEVDGKLEEEAKEKEIAIPEPELVADSEGQGEDKEVKDQGVEPMDQSENPEHNSGQMKPDSNHIGLEEPVSMDTGELDGDAATQRQPQEAHEADENVPIPPERLEHMQKIRKQSLVITQKQAIVPQAPFRQAPLNDASMKLKYSYGVKAYKYWAIKKNAELKAAWKEICQKDGVSIPQLKPVKNELLACSMSELSFYLGLFVNEITKPNGEMYYPDTIFYFCLGIQYYLSENGRSDDIFHDETFVEFFEALNAKLLDSQLRTNIQGLTFCHVTEDHLWESNYLGSMTPYTILETLVYLNTKNFLLGDVDAHMGLSFSNVMKQWKKHVVSSDGKSARTVFLKYNPFSTIQAAVEKKHRLDPNIAYEQLENLDNPMRCPVKMFEFYTSKCPDAIKHRNDVYYLQPEPCCVPSSPVWFSSNQLDPETLSMMITRAKVVREVQESFLTQRTVVQSVAPAATTIHHALANGQAFFVA